MDLDQLERAVDAFSVLDPFAFPLHYIKLFLEVARRERCTFAELEEALNITHGSVSRSVAALSDTNRYGQPGYGLLELHKDPRQTRRYLVMVSPKGKRLLTLLKRA